MRTASPFSRLVIAAGLLMAVLVACGREITGPVSAPVNVFKRFAAFAFEPKYETAMPAHALHAALEQVAFERVRITLRREDGTIALDTVVLFPIGADSLILALNVSLPASAPSTGVPFSLSLGYVNAAGDTVFKGGPLAITVTPSTGGAPPPPVQVPVHYTGPGANATSVVISPKVVNGLAGQSTGFSAQALGSNGQVIAGTPVVFTTSNDGVVTVNSTTGSAELVGRGTASVYALLLTGPRDSAIVTVTLPAARLMLSAGGDQTVVAGATLPQAIVARVVASDGIGVGGVTVSFAASGGGAVTPATAVSDASGNVSTQWKLGPTAGAQTLTVTSAGLAGSPLTVSATALAVTPTKLTILTGPVSGNATTALPAVTVAAQDAAGNVVTNFTGDVTVAIGINPGGSTLTGTTTVKAVAGIATFSDLRLNRPGTDYTLVFSSANLNSATSGAFSITAGDASRLVFGAVPSAVDAGLAIVPAVTVTATDAVGNPVTTFTGAVTVAIGTNPGGATMGGTLTRNAVAGVATFENLTLNRRGVGYTLVAAAPPLAAATSAPFTVTAGTPTTIAVVTGADQKAVRGSTLAPITVQVRDALGNGIPGLTLALEIEMAVVAADVPLNGATSAPRLRSQMASYGTLSASSVTTDETGSATFTWTLGSLVGTQRVEVTLAAPLLEIYISATATPGAVSQLAFTQQPVTRVAGTTFAPVQVTAKDSLGNTVTAFIGTVTLALGTTPCDAALSGTKSVTAVAGVATFGDLSLNVACTGYTLLATGDLLPTATSAAFNVTPGPAAELVLPAGNGGGQSAAVGTALPLPFKALVRDAFFNSVPGTTVTWAVTGGGGSVSATSTVTDASGIAQTTLTLGPTPGTNTVTASSTGLTNSPQTFTATGTVGAAAQLVITTQPPVTATTAGVSVTPAIVLTAKDGSGNTVTSFTDSVTASITTGPAGATIIGNSKTVAVGGVATFSGLAFDKAGTYTLGFAAAGLSGATSSSFSIVAGAAKNIVADSGGAQSGTVATTLPLRLVARVTDQYGNPSSGVAVAWAVTGGGGSLDSSATTTDALGRVRVALTLGATAGANTVTASGTGLTGSPVTFTATGTVGTATQLVISRQPRASSTAGAADTISVDVKDASGNIVTGSTASVTLSIATGPTSATFMGPATVTAVNGVATFIGTAFDKMGTYTLTFASAGLTSATSNSVVVAAGAAKNITADSGQSQVGGAFQQLPVPLVARITDQYGNKVPGTPVTWLVIGSSGTLASSTTVSDTAGRVRTQWTLGGRVGVNVDTVAAGAAGVVPDPLFFLASGTAVGYSKRWTGAVSTDWSDGGNWSPSGVPASTDSVQVDSVANMPVLAASTTVGKLRVQPGATLALSSGSVYLSVNGSVDAGLGASITGTGVLQLNGTGTIVGPSFPYTKVLGTYLLAGSTGFASAVEVGTGGFFNTSGHTTNIAGALSTAGTGVIAMSTSSDVFGVGGNVNLGGGPISFTVGELRIGGNFTQSGASAFQQNGGLTQFIGATAKTITFADTTANSYFFAVTNNGGGVVTLNSPVRLKDKLTVLAGAGAVTGTGKAVRALGVQLADTTQFAVDTLEIWQPGTMAVTSRIVTNLLITANPVLLGNTVTLHGNTVVALSGNLVINSRLLVTDNLSTVGAGQLSMTSGLDSVQVIGNASFAGGVTAGTLTNGGMSVGGNFTSGGAGANAQSFAASGQHRVSFVGAGDKVVRMLNGGVGASQFAKLHHGTTSSLRLRTNVLAEVFATGLGATHPLVGDTSFVPLLVSKGADIRDVTFNGVRWELQNGHPVTTLENVTFQNQDATLTQFAIKRTGTDTTGSIAAAAGSWNFSTVPSTGAYIALQDTDNPAADTLTLNFSGTVSPTAHGGKVVFTNGATSNWPFGLSLTAVTAGGDWNTASTWSPAYVPTANDDVTINSPSYVTLTGTGYARHVTLGTSASLMLSAATLRVSGNVSAPSGYVSGSGSTITVTGAGTHTLNIGSIPSLTVEADAVATAAGMLSIGGDAIIHGRLVPDGNFINVSGILDIRAGGALKMTKAADSVVVSSAIFAGVASGDSLLTDGKLVVSNSFSQSGGATSFAPTGNHVTWLSGGGILGSSLMASRTQSLTESAVLAPRRARVIVPNLIQFASPGWSQSRFNILRINHTNDAALNFSSDVYALRAEGVGMSYTSRTLSASSPVRFYVKGSNLKNLLFYGVALQVDAGGVLDMLDTLTFSNQDATADQLTLNLAGNLTLNQFTFNTLPTTGRYLTATGSSPVTLTLQNPSPSSNGGKVSLSNVTLAGWPSSISFVSASGGTWTSSSTWSPAGVPSRYDDISLAAGHSITMTSSGEVRNVTLAANSGLTISYATLKVFGNWSADTLSSNSTNAGTVQFVNTSTVSGRLGATTFDAPVTINGTSIFGSVSTRGGAFDVSSQNVRVTGTFETDSVGYLKMTNASGLLRVDGNATFNGASTNTTLTDGVLRLNSGLVQTGDPAAFSATGSHRTILTGESFSANASFANPGTTTTTSHFGIVQVGDTGSRTITLDSDLYAVGSLERGTAGMTLSRGSGWAINTAPRFHVANVHSSATLTLNGTMLRVFSPDGTTSLSYATFQNLNMPGIDQLTVEHSGSSALTVNMSSLTFTPVDTTSFNFVAANYLGTGGSLALNFTSMSPISSTALPKTTKSGAPLPTISWMP